MEVLAEEDEEQNEDNESDSEEEEGEDSDKDQRDELIQDFPGWWNHFFVCVKLLPGFWMDDPIEEIYIPHITIMNSDPKCDKKLGNQV